MPKRYVFIMFGYVGSGKSYVTTWLAPHIQAVVLRVDKLRWAMFGEDRPELYTPENKALANNALQYAAAQILEAGTTNLILDANFNQRTVRRNIEEKALAHQATPVVVWVTTPEQVAKERIQTRAATEGHVIFDPSIIETMRKTTDMPGDDELVIKLDGLQTAAEQQKAFAEQLAALEKR